MTPYRLARAIGVPPRRINGIVHGRRSTPADTALRMGRALGTTPELRLDFQRHHDPDVARGSLGIDFIEPLVDHEATAAVP